LKTARYIKWKNLPWIQSVNLENHYIIGKSSKMIGLTLVLLGILTLQAFSIASGMNARVKRKDAYMYCFSSLKGSSINCSMFETDEEIFASLPFNVSINPVTRPSLDHYASFGTSSRIVELQLYNLASIPPAIFCLGNLSQLVIKDGNATIPEDISQLKFLTSLSILRMVRFTYRRQALKIIQQSFFFRRNPAQLQLL
jgi:hypothetical protein